MTAIDAPDVQVQARLDRLAVRAAWIRAWTPAVLLRWCWRHRLAAVVILAGFLALMIGAAYAIADPGTGADTGGGDAMIAWQGIKDSDGVPVAKYTLTLNQGGWDAPIYAAWATIDSAGYEIYLGITSTALWLIRFVMTFEWLGLFTGPFKAIGRGVDDAMDQFGLAPMALAVLAIIAVATTLAGRTAKAVSNLAMGLIMVGLAATIFAHPLGELVGPDGLLAKGRDTGLQIATSVSDHEMSSRGGSANVDTMVERLADRFLRKPTQMINFGEVSDSVSRKCREAWSRGVKQGHDDKLKDDIAGCDKDKGPAMHQKSMGSPAAVIVPLIMCGLLSLVLVAFACYFVWHVVRAAVQAMLYAALAPPAFAIGVIPGGAQTFAWKTILDAAMAFTAMIIYTVAFGGYNVILDRVFKESNAIKAIFLTALVLAFGFAFFSPLRRILDRSRDTVAARLSGGSAGGSNRTWLNRAADASRVKNEVGQAFKRGKRGGGRDAGKIDSESESSTRGSGATTAATQQAPTVSGSSSPRADDFVGQGTPAGSGGGGGATTGSGGSRSTEATASSPGHNRERLAEAIRLARAARGGGGAASAHGSGRHALSEAA
ncbi:hypothetical protein [Mycobacterium sp.]|uniref:hypothetical protein n=1 Tax=Mycobacterium sp. TaxID=1785 RepID=UPI0025D12F9A|nr:hypothetical protein [Mycobacterium sp.]